MNPPLTDKNECHLQSQSGDGCVLMFSGGRDSTLSALRLARQGIPLTLVTIVSGHLFGLRRVRERVEALKSRIPKNTRWLIVRQNELLATDTSFYERTCLPCHHAYVVAAAIVGAKLGTRSLAFGYTMYQSDWPEQTPLAVGTLRRLLGEFGISLVLPVADVASKSEMIYELERQGVSGESLEQKCVRQVMNVKLDEQKLVQQVGLWEAAIRASLSSLGEIALKVENDVLVGEIEAETILT